PSLLLTYSVPSDIAQQVDLLSAKSIPYLSSAQQIVSLLFNHALTAIQFKTGSQLPSGITIKSISFKNIPYKGTHKLGETGNSAWTVDQTQKRDFTLTLNYSSDGTTGKDITTPSQTFMMIPQRLPSDATLQVVVAKNGVDKTLSLSLNNFLWEQGKKLIYNISTKSIVYTYSLEAASTGSANYDGTGNISYTVKSTKTDGFGHASFVPWTMEFSTDNGNTWSASKPDFITLTTQENNGDLTAKSYTANFAPQEKTIGGTSADILKARPILSGVDLSMVDVLGNEHHNGQTTANCYVIHNPGTYKFPTMYGNSRKNGQNNTSAYTSTKSGSNILSPFLGAHGPITKPQIDGIDNACLIWQDTQNLISNISYTGDGYVHFSVDKATIHNGNAIIAVRDNSNTILWSWHIWVTEEDLTPVEITNYQGYKYNILPVNLGWCGFGNPLYAERSLKVRIKQEEGNNKTQELTFTQQKQEWKHSKYYGNCTFYQWGRKDPILPSNGIGNVNKECFTTEDQYQFKYGSEGLNTNDIKEYIKHPNKYSTRSEMDGQYYNLWSTDNDKTDANDDKVIKTVYDPSPVGYSLPASNAFTGFTRYGGNTNYEYDFNVQNKRINNGYHFYTKPNQQGSTVFFPTCGYRTYDSALLLIVALNGFYWMAGPHSLRTARALSFYSKRIDPLQKGSRNNSYTVRCAQEK
ncbi:MAG: fimbrillin family protein, partial [Candidatus Cryptobacteroides sp.]